MANDQHRLFFALWPEIATRNELADLSNRLRSNTPARWIRPENLHITLAFLGDVEKGRIKSLASAASEVEPRGVKFKLDRIEHWRKPQVICLTAAERSGVLDDLATDLTSRLRNAGFILENRPFLAHLTLARKAVAHATEIRLQETIVWKSREFVLVESTHHPEGSLYTTLSSWPLR